MVACLGDAGSTAAGLGYRCRVIIADLIDIERVLVCPRSGNQKHQDNNKNRQEFHGLELKNYLSPPRKRGDDKTV